jgi:hypothetical protein
MCKNPGGKPPGFSYADARDLREKLATGRFDKSQLLRRAKASKEENP